MAEHEAVTGAAQVAHEAFHQDPNFWVAASFVVFLILALKPICKSLAKMLDARSEQISRELVEAQKLREEAEAVLASYQKKQRESLQEAETMLATARTDAARIVEKAETDLKISMEKRMKQATDKIAQAEAKAVQDVQAYVTDIALATSRKLITEHLEQGGNEELIRKAVADAAGKIH